ncbi:MAG: NfeD family protein [Roseburia sp.]|nr:NfeD family protein [Roseburia sp.]
MENILWLALIIVFVVVEIATVGLTAIWFAGGAFAALLAQLLGLNIYWQIGIFIAASAILLVVTRPWALKYMKPRLVKTNYEAVIGVNVCLTEDVDNMKGTGTAVYKGQEWSARAYDEEKTFEAGTIVSVKEIRGVTLYVVESTRMPAQHKTDEV